MNYVLIAVIFVVLAVIAITLNLFAARRRSRAMEQVAANLGLKFYGNLILKNLRDGYRTRLLRSGGRIANLMTGEGLNTMMAVFDMVIVTGKQTKTETVAGFRFHLPAFELRRRRFADHIDSFTDEVVFDNMPEFSRLYVVRSPDNAAASAVLTPDVMNSLAALDDRNVWAIESTGAWLFVYHDVPPEIFSKRSFVGTSWRVEPGAIPDFVRDAMGIAGAFTPLAVIVTGGEEEHGNVNVRVNRKIRVGGKEYHSTEEMPPEVRELFERAMGSRQGPGVHLRRKIVFNGVEYDSVDSMTPEVRRLYEQALGLEGGEMTGFTSDEAFRSFRIHKS